MEENVGSAKNSPLVLAAIAEKSASTTDNPSEVFHSDSQPSKGKILLSDDDDDDEVDEEPELIYNTMATMEPEEAEENVVEIEQDELISVR